MTDLDQRLFAASREGRADEVAGLVAQGADVNTRHPKYCDHGAFLDGFTPLMWAVASPRSNAATVKALFDAGSDVFAVSDGEVTALWYAAGGGTGYPLTPENLKDLDEGHPFRDWGGGDVERLRLILDAGANPNEASDNGRTAVVEACGIGDADRLRLLIERGASVGPTKEGKKWSFAIPLFEAAEAGNAECVRLILDQGFPANTLCQGESALDVAGSVEAAQVLWDAGCRPTNGRFGFDSVDNALDSGRTAVAEFLLGKVVESDRPAYLNAKLLTASGVHMNPDSVRLLLRLGADPNYAGDTGLGTPLSYCCWQGDGNGARENETVSQTLEVLISSGAKVDGLSGNRIPLHEAVSGDWGSPTSVRTLLDHGANPNILNDARQTAIMIAAMHGELGCVRELLARGADKSLKDLRGKTALDYAKEHLKVWEGIVRKPPTTVWKFAQWIGIKEDDTREHHKQALKEAWECVRHLSV
jgi:ankyrin repeat protein